MKIEELSEPIIKALKTAYQLGQTYWQQADSESYIQHKKSDITHQKFNDLLLSTTEELQTKLKELQQENENVRLANLDCVENFNALMKDYTDLQKELIEIEEREYKNKLIESR